MQSITQIGKEKKYEKKFDVFNFLIVSIVKGGEKTMHIALEGTAKELDFANVYEMYVNDIYRLCFSFMKNHMDAEDAVQETFLKYYHSEKTFDTLEHKKAWLIVTASNQCKDMLKHWWRQRKNIEEYKNVLDDNSMKTDEMLAIIIELPDKYKTSIYLYYYEGYNSREIAQILKKPESTIRTYLQKAKKMIRKEIETE